MTALKGSGAASDGPQNKGAASDGPQNKGAASDGPQNKGAASDGPPDSGPELKTRRRWRGRLAELLLWVLVAVATAVILIALSETVLPTNF